MQNVVSARTFFLDVFLLDLSTFVNCKCIRLQTNIYTSILVINNKTGFQKALLNCSSGMHLCVHSIAIISISHYM